MGEDQKTAGVRIAHMAGARVTVELCWDAFEPGIEVRFAPRGAGSPPGHVIEIWEQAVARGVRYALGVARSLPCGVRIAEVCGDPAHARPTLFAAAAAQAVWEALEYEPPPEVTRRLQAHVEESGRHGQLWLPDL
jgi:hypothetical protein